MWLLVIVVWVVLTVSDAFVREDSFKPTIEQELQLQLQFQFQFQFHQQSSYYKNVLYKKQIWHEWNLYE
jgi:hypothetical protein